MHARPRVSGGGGGGGGGVGGGGNLHVSRQTRLRVIFCVDLITPNSDEVAT